jgi:hypothetical protein
VVTAANREDELSRKFALLAPVLDERQRRLWMAVEAREAGHGGITMVARATGAARSTVTRRVDELDSSATDSGRVRRASAGRKRADAVNPELTVALERLVDPDSRGDPELPLRWTIKSTRQLSAALTGQGIRPASGWCGGCCTRPATADHGSLREDLRRTHDALPHRRARQHHGDLRARLDHVM